jgi:hypothetical protein
VPLASTYLGCWHEHSQNNPYGPIERRLLWPIYPIKRILAVGARSRRREEAIYTRSSRRTLALLSPNPLPHPPTTGGGDDDGDMVQRLTYRKRHSYATKSNQTRVVKTPGPDSLPLFFPTRFLALSCAASDLFVLRFSLS